MCLCLATSYSKSSDTIFGWLAISVSAFEQFYGSIFQSFNVMTVKGSSFTAIKLTDSVRSMYFDVIVSIRMTVRISPVCDLGPFGRHRVANGYRCAAVITFECLRSYRIHGYATLRLCFIRGVLATSIWSETESELC